MATHSSVPAWRIPGIEEPGGLLSMGSHRGVPAWRIPGTGEPGGLLSMGSHRVGLSSSSSRELSSRS